MHNPNPCILSVLEVGALDQHLPPNFLVVIIFKEGYLLLTAETFRGWLTRSPGEQVAHKSPFFHVISTLSQWQRGGTKSGYQSEAGQRLSPP